MLGFVWLCFKTMFLGVYEWASFMHMYALGGENQLKLICPPKLTHLNNTQTHQIINWAKWVLTQLDLIMTQVSFLQIT